MSERYVHLDGNLYYDTKDSVIVKNMGNRYVYVRHDRRTKKKDVPENELKRESDKSNKNLIRISEGIYFDKVLIQIYRMINGKLVLYSKDRRKESKSVSTDRRKKK
ncbi:MAG TPA: hypothetical protein PLB12_05215 [Candidatus Goldiibacteriota bacterium]|nr:hypothetical protein [Candidatus Goldiibacteriota bacterium]HRQ43733.1 hypothetical protein [Candidatus Goldiibacteriota bacterium]